MAAEVRKNLGSEVFDISVDIQSHIQTKANLPCNGLKEKKERLILRVLNSYATAVMQSEMSNMVLLEVHLMH